MMDGDHTQPERNNMTYIDVMSVVEKIDDGLKKFNKRVIHLHEGVVKYHSKIPKNFSPTSRPKGLLPPKAGIKVEHLSDMYDSDVTLNKLYKDKIICIQFQRRDLMSASQLQSLKQSTSVPKVEKPQKAKSELVKWVFLFKTVDDRNKWADIFAKNIQQFGDPDKSLSIRSFFDNYKNTDEQNIFSAPTKTFGNQEDQQNDNQDNTQDVGKLAAKQRVENFQKLKIDAQKEAEIRRMKQQQDLEQERLLQEEEQKRLAVQREDEQRKRKDEEINLHRKQQERQIKIKVQTAWEFRYFQLMEDCIDTSKDFEESMKTGVKLVKLVEVFRDQAVKVVKNIILELIEAEVRKTIKKDIFTRKQSKIFGDFPDPAEGRKQSILMSQPRSIYQKKPDKLTKKEEDKSYTEVLKDMTEGKYVFNRNNMLIKIACPETIEKVLWFSTKTQFFKVIQNRFASESLMSSNEQAFFRTSVHSKKRSKTLQEEFKALNYLNDLCMTLRVSDKNFRIKVPLCCLVEHMGFTALVIAKPPCSLDESSLSYGHLGGIYKASGKLDRELESLGRILGIKPHNFFWNAADIQPKRRQTMALEEKRSTVYLSFFTEVHVGKFEEFEQLKSQFSFQNYKSMLKLYSEEEIDIFEMRRQGLFYLNKCQDIIPNIMEEEYAQLFEVYQQIKVSSNLDEEQMQLVDECVNGYPSYKARPEFIRSYFNTGYLARSETKNAQNYNPDAYETIQESNDVHADQLELAEMSKFYKRQYIPQFVKKIDDMEICPMDSHSVREAMHLFGISMRHMGDVARLTTQPHIRSLFEREMIARTLKNIFHTQLVEEVLSIRDESLPLKNIEIKPQPTYTDTEDIEQERKPTKNSFKRASVMLPQLRTFQERMQVDEFLEVIHKTHVIDFLNLVFSSQSKMFWEQIIQKQVLSDFNYDIEVAINGVCPGGLLHALLYNIKMDVEYEPMQVHASTPYPCVSQQEIIQKYKLKQYLTGRSYQQFFTESFDQTKKSHNVTNISTPKHSQKSFQGNKITREAIFQIEDIVEMQSNVQSYSLQDLEIMKLCNRYNNFKNSNNFELAIKTLNIRLNLVEGTTQSHSLPYLRSNIYNDMASLYLKEKDYHACVVRLILALQELQTIFVPQLNLQVTEYCLAFITQILKTKLKPKQGVIRPLLILFQCLIEYQDWQEFVLPYFDIIMFIIEFSYGTQHPLYAQVFSLMAQFFLSKKLLEDCSLMHQSQIICLLQTVGQSHKATAEAYLELAMFQNLILNQKDESILQYEKAQLVYETLYGVDSFECSQVAVHLASVYSLCGKSKHGLDQADIALKFYTPKTHGNVKLILKLKYLRCYNLTRLKYYVNAKQEAEQFLKVILNNWDEIVIQNTSEMGSSVEQSEQSQYSEDEDEEQAPSNQNQNKQLPNFCMDVESADNTTELFRVYMELFLQDIDKDHRNFLFQVFDQIQENFARDGLLDYVDEKTYSSVALSWILNKLRTLLTIEVYLEKMLANFLDSTGADTNKFVFNFKKDPKSKVKSIFKGDQNFLEAVEDYENLVIALGKKFFLNLFLKLTIT